MRLNYQLIIVDLYIIHFNEDNSVQSSVQAVGTMNNMGYAY